MADCDEKYGFFTDLEQANDSVVQYVIKSKNMFHVRSFCIQENESTCNMSTTIMRQYHQGQQGQQGKQSFSKNREQYTEEGMFGESKTVYEIYNINKKIKEDNEDYEDELEDSFTTKTIGYIVLLFVFSVYIIII
jgi:hypothetical protein